MTFVTYRRGGEDRLGVLDAARTVIFDVALAADALGASMSPGDMLALIDAGDEGIALIARILDESDAIPNGAKTPLSDAEIRAPIPRPRKNVFAIGLNYVAHNKEFTAQDTMPSHPIVFTKAPTSVVGPDDDVVIRPEISDQNDYEGELAVVIGKRGSDIEPEDAEAHIFGYAIVNDVTARDLQKRTSQWFMGKTLDTFCPMGPYLVHKSEIGWPVKLNVRTTINGELRQDSNTDHLYFDIPTLIATISAGVTLEPGDVIATGTPEGVGIGFDPPKFLHDGDEMVVEIEKLGMLRNRVRAG